MLPGVLLLFEKMFASPNRKNMVFASLSLLVLFLCDLQITIFSIYYILLRVAYYFAINFNKNKNMPLLKRLLECGVLFSFFAAPFLISFTLLQNVGALSVTSIPSVWLSVPSQYFLRGAGSISAISGSVTYSFYLGIILFVLSIVPMFLSNTQSKFNRQNYVFHWLTFVFFMLIAIGTPLSTLVTTLFVRVPNRGQMLIVLSFCMCAGYGLSCLNDFLSRKSKRIHWIRKSKLFYTLLIIGLATVIFVDLTSEISSLDRTSSKVNWGPSFY